MNRRWLNGKCIEVIDTRILENEKLSRISLIKEECAEAILKEAPEHKQRNATAGILSDEEAGKIWGHIKACKDKCALIKDFINAETDIMKLDKISWGEFK